LRGNRARGAQTASPADLLRGLLTARRRRSVTPSGAWSPTSGVC
jgi:hypothetical protein